VNDFCQGQKKIMVSIVEDTCSLAVSEPELVLKIEDVVGSTTVFDPGSADVPRLPT
jgi:hypothetical protein